MKNNTQIMLFFLIVAILALVFSCTREDPPVKINLDEKMHIKPVTDQDVITYAYLPQYSHTVSYKRHHLLVKYLRRRTGLNIKQIFPDTFDQHMLKVGSGEVDISFSNPFIYIKIADRFNARAFARIVTIEDQEKFRGQIICRSDRTDIKNIRDCRGKTWIAVDKTSAGGYLFPLGLFYAQGIELGDFKQIAFAPGPGAKQEKVVFAVHGEKYDIGTIREGTLNVVADRINISDIQIIANTPLYPGWVYAAQKDLDDTIIKKIKSALLALDFNKNEDRPVLESADFIKVISSKDRDFNSIRTLVRDLGVGE